MNAQELDICMRRYYKCVYSMALCYCKNPSDADDIAQDVFLKLFTSEVSFSNDDQLKAWLLKCAVNRSINILKSGWHRLSRPLEEAENAAYTDKYGTESDNLLPLVLKLNKNSRTALYLYYYEHYTVEEISRITNASETAVRSRLARGRQKLKKMLEDKKSDQRERNRNYEL